MTLNLETAARTNSPGERRRKAILEAAYSLFIEKGYAGVSVDDIIAISGGSKSTLYKFFGNKEGVLAAVTEALANEMLKEMVIPAPAGKSLRDTLKRVGLNVTSLILSDKAINQYRLAIFNSTENPALSQLWYHHGPKTTLSGFAKYLEKEVRAGRLKISNTERASQLFLGMIVFKDNLTMSIGAAAPTKSEIEEMVTEAVDVFLAAYGA